MLPGAQRGTETLCHQAYARGQPGESNGVSASKNSLNPERPCWPSYTLPTSTMCRFMQPRWQQLQPSLQTNKLLLEPCLSLPVVWSSNATQSAFLRVSYHTTQEQHAQYPASACDSRSHDMHAWTAVLQFKYAWHVSMPAKHCKSVRKTPASL